MSSKLEILEGLNTCSSGLVIVFKMQIVLMRSQPAHTDQLHSGIMRLLKTSLGLIGQPIFFQTSDQTLRALPRVVWR